ncbi:hypothetical protein BDN70DRAFT_909445 [Pholiota conissans]|uniref:Uncharacterized protein n=1 Tax=Pholiota conissans TaxID=109636 RepID=A0A9P5YLY0_9AGAR|nr:hypothetical protein BDN70DRAFT_909445 [Pholiota conissans]
MAIGQWHCIILPCDRNGNFLPPFTTPLPFDTPDATEDSNYSPFPDRLSFDWTHYQFIELQSSASKINQGLNLWLAAKLKAGDLSPLPFSRPDDMYQMIDAIQEGDAPFRTIQLRYPRPLPSKPPKWMTQTYELCMRDSRKLLHNQLATSDFANHFNYVPYRQFDHQDRPWDEAVSMLVTAVCGSDKTTVSVATGHQEYHPVYQSPGNLTNTAHRGHGNSVLPVAFLPIPKTSKHKSKHPEFQRFARQLYHTCLAIVFAPLPIYSLGPYIADYSEQVWLAGILQGWCPKCEGWPECLDHNYKDTRQHRHERTDVIIQSFNLGTIREHYGLRTDVVPFTHGFPRADIHELLSPDLLHQLIKGTFKDHLVTWVNEFLHIKHAVPLYAGLRRFSDGQNFEQWTGDDSKALMKVYILAIAGHVPSEVVQCIATFTEICYILRRNAITSPALAKAEALIDQFHALRQIFIAEGVRKSISLPRQHSLLHYPPSIALFSSPNGLCSSITESKHIEAMLITIVRLEKLAALCRRFLREKLLVGSTASAYMGLRNQDQLDLMNIDNENDLESEGWVQDEEDPNQVEKYSLDDAGPDEGLQALSSIELAATPERSYPKRVDKLAQHINEPQFPMALKTFLYARRHPNHPIPNDIDTCVGFSGKIQVFHSAIARFYAPSDLCGASGMYHERIQSTPSWYGHPHYDTAFVVQDDDSNQMGMSGVLVTRVCLLFSFRDEEDGEIVSCALVSWYLLASKVHDHDTGMWSVKPEGTQDDYPVQVIPLKSIA